MEITVRYFTVLSRVTGKRQEKIDLREGSAIENLLARLTKIYGTGFGRFVSSGRQKNGLQLVCLLNGEEVAQTNGFKTKLHKGDIVALVPPISGG